jgi:NCAIR mutase (PurE)-related protein
MERKELTRLLRALRAGRVTVEEAADRARGASVERLGFATLDLERAVRRGFPEVVFGPGKTPEQVAAVVERLTAAGQTTLVTRVGPDVFEVVRRSVPKAVYEAEARAIVVRRGRARKGKPGVLIITAGTADIPVAAEAALTAELMGNRVQVVHDVGVAGIHRLLDHRDEMLAANVIVAIAGMEGALPSVIAGLVDCPVIGVPTDVGSGFPAPGQAPLWAMLNSCAAGLTVVNVNNGFGAGYAAGLVNRRARERRSPAAGKLQRGNPK